MSTPASLNLAGDRLTVPDFLDHVLREHPTSKFTAVKRSFFDGQQGEHTDIGNGVLAFKGVYQAIRPSIVSPSLSLPRLLAPS